MKKKYVYFLYFLSFSIYGSKEDDFKKKHTILFKILHSGKTAENELISMFENSLKKISQDEQPQFLNIRSSEECFKSNDMTFLHYAVFSNFFLLTKFLLEKGVNKDLQISPGQETALAIAVKKKHLEIAKLLLEKKANALMLFEGKYGKYLPLHWALLKNEFDEIFLKQLAQATYNRAEIYRENLYEKSENVFEEITPRTTYRITKNPCGILTIKSALYREKLEKILQKREEDRNKLYLKELPPLLIALIGKKPGALKIFLEYEGAEAKDKRGLNVAHLIRRDFSLLTTLSEYDKRVYEIIASYVLLETLRTEEKEVISLFKNGYFLTRKDLFSFECAILNEKKSAFLKMCKEADFSFLEEVSLKELVDLKEMAQNEGLDKQIITEIEKLCRKKEHLSLLKQENSPVLFKQPNIDWKCKAIFCKSLNEYLNNWDKRSETQETAADFARKLLLNGARFSSYSEFCSYIRTLKRIGLYQINAKDEKGKTALHYLGLRSSDIALPISKQLTEDGAIHTRDKEGNYPLHILLNTKNYTNEIIKLWARSMGADILNEVDQRVELPLSMAVTFNDIDTFKTLCEQGACPFIDDRNGVSAGILALNKAFVAKTSNCPTVTQDKGAECMIASYLIKENHLKLFMIIEALLLRFSTRILEDKQGEEEISRRFSYIRRALENLQEKNIQILRSRESRQKQSNLLMKIERKAFNILGILFLSYLVEKKTTIFKKTLREEKLLRTIIEKNQWNTCAKMINNCLSTEENGVVEIPMTLEIDAYIKDVSKKIKEGSDVRAIDSAKNTPLHIAINERDMLHIKRILQNDPPFDAQNITGATPFLLVFISLNNESNAASFKLLHDILILMASCARQKGEEYLEKVMAIPNYDGCTCKQLVSKMESKNKKTIEYLNSLRLSPQQPNLLFI